MTRALAILTAACGATAIGQPVVSTWAVDGADDTASVAAAALAGWYATGDSFEDSVEIRRVDQSLVRTLDRARLLALAPWMSLNGGTDGVGAIAFSDSGRMLFIALHDDTTPSDGLGGDAILRYDTDTDTLTLFARLEITSAGFPWPHGSMVHYRGRLYVGTPGAVRVYVADRDDTTGALLTSWPLGSGAMVTGLAIDRVNNLLFASANGQISRTPVLGAGTGTFTTVGAIANVRALAWSDQALSNAPGGVGGTGGSGQGGLYALEGTDTPGFGRVWFIPTSQSRGLAAYSPIAYISASVNWHDLAATADGSLLIGADEDAVRVRDASDSRLRYDQWVQDEFNQHIAFAKSLITPTFAPGTPAGWVIDGDVIPGNTRFHPATPDAAAWTILALIAADEVNNDPLAKPLVRLILQRYSGRAPDGVVPRRSADGQFTHWIDPMTGQVKSGWPTELATMSTMLIATAATRAGVYYADDPEIVESARAIVCGVTSWDTYLTFPAAQMYLVGQLSGGPDFGSASSGLHEGLLYMDLAQQYGLQLADAVAGVWFDAGHWPGASYVAGRPVRSFGTGQFLPTFVHSYPLLTVGQYRDDPAWFGSATSNSSNLRAAQAGWTDDNGVRFNTAFSAGTTLAAYGGYHADSLSDHPGDFAAFPSLIALSATREPAAQSHELVGAYAAYRAGARQSFLGGASLLWRRSNLAPTVTLPDGAIPDMTHAALALGEALSPGLIDRAIARGYVRCGCLADFDSNGGIDGGDLAAFFAAFEAGEASADVDGNGGVDGGDLALFFGAFEAGC